MSLLFIGIAFILGFMTGCYMTMPIIMQIVKAVDKYQYTKGTLDTLERFKHGNNKKTN